jgi:hypothetical protein
MGTVPARSVRLLKTGVTNISGGNLNAARLCGLSTFLPFNTFTTVTLYRRKMPGLWLTEKFEKNKPPALSGGFLEGSAITDLNIGVRVHILSDGEK